MNVQYIVTLAEELQFPAEAVACMQAAASKLAQTCPALLDDALWGFEHAKWQFHGMEQRFAHMAEQIGSHTYTVAMVFLLAACEGLECRYAEAGHCRSLFVDTMTDLRWKLVECKNTKGVWGTFVWWWFSGFFDMTRFTLGRFQYEKTAFPHNCFSVNGCTVKEGDTVLNFHIPSGGGPLTEEVRLDSYRRARAFFDPENQAPTPFVCSSWLLWPDYESYIPDTMNIKHFRHDFAVISTLTHETFADAWRVFAADAEKPAGELPRRTSQQRMFADYVADGGKHGSGYGIFFFDGEKILH